MSKKIYHLVPENPIDVLIKGTKEHNIKWVSLSELRKIACHNEVPQPARKSPLFDYVSQLEDEFFELDPVYTYLCKWNGAIFVLAKNQTGFEYRLDMTIPHHNTFKSKKLTIPIRPLLRLRNIIEFIEPNNEGKDHTQEYASFLIGLSSDSFLTNSTFLSTITQK